MLLSGRVDRGGFRHLPSSSFCFYLCPSLFHIFWAFPAFSTPGKSVQRLNNVSPVNESSPLSYEQPSSPLSPSSKSPGLSTELQSRTKVVVKVAHLNTIIGPFQTPYIDVQHVIFRARFQTRPLSIPFFRPGL